MTDQQFIIPADGSRVFLAPNFTIRNYQAFNESTANLSIFSPIGILEEVIGPGGFTSQNPNRQYMSAQLGPGAQGFGRVIVSDTVGGFQPATAPLVGSPATGVVEPALVGSGGAAGVTVTVPYTAAVAPGHGLVCFITSNTGTPTVSDSAGNTWAEVGTAIEIGGTTFLACFAVQSAMATPAGATITIIAGNVSALFFDVGLGLTLNNNATTSQASPGPMNGPAMAPGSNLYLSAICSQVGEPAVIFGPTTPYTFLSSRFDSSGSGGRTIAVAGEIALQQGTISPVWNASANVGTCALFGLSVTVLAPQSGLPH